MKKAKQIGTSVNVIYGVMTVLFVLDILGILEIKSESIKTLVHAVSLISTPLILIYNWFLHKSKRWNIWVGIASLFVVSSFSIIVYKQSLLGYLFSTGSWKTQTILYERGNGRFNRIEFQMKDIGALGYRRRYVRVTYLTNWFMITEKVDPDTTFGSDWKRVDKNVNELGIVY